MPLAPLAAIAAAACVVCYLVGNWLGRTAEVRRQRRAHTDAESAARRITAEAEREADNLRKSAVVAGKEELITLREAWEVEVRQRRDEVERDETRVKERDTILDRKFEILDQREKETAVLTASVGRRDEALRERERELERLAAEERRRLEQLAGMSTQDARAELMRLLEEQAQADAANRIREIR